MSVGIWVRNSSSSESSSSSSYGGAGFFGGGGAGGRGGGGGAPVPPWQSIAYVVKRWRGIFYQRLEDVSLVARHRAFYSRKLAGKRRRRGGKRREAARWHSFHVGACSDAMARCAAAKLLSFAAPLLDAGNKASGDDEAAGHSLIVGHAWVTRLANPPHLDRVWIECSGWKNVSCRMKFWFRGAAGRDFLRRCPKSHLGDFSGASGDALTLILSKCCEGPWSRFRGSARLVESENHIHRPQRAPMPHGNKIQNFKKIWS
jgi:hypothetical protein